MKRALIVAATGGFLNGFLIPDMKLLQEMGYEVHCAANGNSVSTFVPEERFASIGVTFHADAFAEKIKLLSDREVRSSMQKACVEKAEEFRLEISHQQMTDIYKNLLDGQEKSK